MSTGDKAPLQKENDEAGMDNSKSINDTLTNDFDQVRCIPCDSATVPQSISAHATNIANGSIVATPLSKSQLVFQEGPVFMGSQLISHNTHWIHLMPWTASSIFHLGMTELVWNTTIQRPIGICWEPNHLARLCLRVCATAWVES